ncbi:MAG TPA: zinc ribbon domain-containing protein [Thermoplasmata archaeon]|nr:zinc ribbon domain-containing protein [Thermoplasmata archaeon]
MYCPKCGAQLPDSAAFCMKCGTNLAAAAGTAKAASPAAPILAPSGTNALKCPNCGAPISPQFGEMVITCAYCGSGVTLGNAGWKGIDKQTMLPIRVGDQSTVTARIRELMDRGLLHRHLAEDSKLEEMNLSLVPYWIVSVAATTTIVASDVAMEAGQIATTAALAGLIGGAMGGRRGGFGFGGPLIAGTMMGGMMGGGFGGGGARKSYEFADNYNFPVVALKALFEHQPRDYQFNLQDRTFFDVNHVPKGIKILNGDVGEDGARYEAKALVTQLQSQKAHEKYHMIQELHSDVEAGDVELLHAPIWFARYDHQGQKIALVVDGNSGGVINSLGL